ncbi:unnamed protein product [Rangifer tarandus platyrhynchus]|uniref:Uncharacterized protein n=2 Tax=Rangifer tarandus platyrhynchus TaxID=3082113 RepID=A0AC59ZHM7_RANTA|nr:unnamed protein product [Rangifer tarandus platyrhynchus]
MRSQVGLLSIRHVRGLCGLPCGSCPPLMTGQYLCLQQRWLQQGHCNLRLLWPGCQNPFSRLNNWLLATAGIFFFKPGHALKGLLAFSVFTAEMGPLKNAF